MRLRLYVVHGSHPCAAVERAGDEVFQPVGRELIWAGTIGDPDRPNAADLQLCSTIRLMLTMADARALIDGRPCAGLALRLFPNADGELPRGLLPPV